MGLDKEYKIVIVGYGRLGQAMAGYISKNEKNFHIVGIFDVKQSIQGIQDVEIGDVFMSTCGSLANYIAEEQVDIAVICVPPEKGQIVADTVVGAGVKAIWNFTAIDLDVPDKVAVENVHMSDSLHALVYYMNELEQEQ